MGEAFVERIELLAFQGGGPSQTAPGRMPLLYILASSGRGKTEALRTVAMCASPSADVPDPAGSPVVVMGLSFNGSFPVLPAEEDCTNFSRGYYLLLYVRLLYCELAKFGRNPLTSFGAFMTTFYAGLTSEHTGVEGEYTPDDVKEEARSMIVRKVSLAGPGARLVLLVDELGLLSTSSAGAKVCKMLKQDIKYPIRSEACALADNGVGVAIFSSLDRALMIAEQTASGRRAKMVRSIDPPKFAELFITMSNALWSRPRKVDDELAVSVGSTRLKMKVTDCAEVYALMAGSSWRAGALTALALKNVRKLDFFDVAEAVNTGTSSGRSASAYVVGAGSASKPAQGNPQRLPPDLWSAPPEFRDAVLAAVFVAMKVRADDLVLPRPFTGGHLGASTGGRGGAEREAPAAGASSALGVDTASLEDGADAVPADRTADAAIISRAADARPSDQRDKTKEEEEEVRNERDAVALAEYERWRNLSVWDLTWGDARALAYITAGGDKTFVPGLTGFDAVAGVTAECTPSALMDAFKMVVDVVVEQAEDAPIDLDDASPSQETARKTLVGAKWEELVMYAEYLRSICRARFPTAYSSVTLLELLGIGAAYVGEDRIVRDVRVNASVAHKEVRRLAGKVGNNTRQPDTVMDLLRRARSFPKQVSRTVFLLPNNFFKLDGVFFLVGPDGPVAVWVQAKKRGATALPDGNPVTILRKLHKDESKLVELFGGQDEYDYWLPRSCYLHVVDNELTKPDKNEHPAAGAWTERAIIRTRTDLPRLLGRTVYSLGRLLALVSGQDVFSD
ncbi:hypothetical protein I4F81_005268 [Pyropia yezoensis]|nr:hypothetical protein I4F81_005268 [Neopyropia yezoensis]